MSTYGERVELARKHGKCSQDELAEIAGIKQPSVSYLVTTAQGSTRTCSIARRCGVNPYWLETGNGSMLEEGYLVAEFHQPYIDKKTEGFLKMWDALKREDRTFITTTMEALIEKRLKKTSPGKSVSPKRPSTRRHPQAG